MATIRDYFDTDFTSDLSTHQTTTARSVDGSITADVILRLHYAFNANAKYVSFYIPLTDGLFDICLCLLTNIETTLSLSEGVEVQCGNIGQDEMIPDSELRFAGRVFIYHDGDASPERKATLREIAAKHGIGLVLRGPQYALERSALEKPLAFISHDSRDKDKFARPLAIELTGMMCPVWFDEFSLNVGDNLRESIEKGLRECKKCVLILSPHFLSNEGWTKVEFDSIFAREIAEKDRFILPVWCDVTKQQVSDYCLSLGNKVGVSWDLGVKEVARRLRKMVQ